MVFIIQNIQRIIKESKTYYVNHTDNRRNNSASAMIQIEVQ